MLRVLLSPLTAALLLISPAQAAEVGDRLDTLSLQDAAEQVIELNAATRRIYATADRRGDRLLNEALQGLDQAALDAQGAIVVADISAAPAFVRRIIRRDLRDRRYRTGLDQTGDTRTRIPYRANQVSVIDLEDLRITAITGHGEVQSLRALFTSPPTTAP